MRLLWGNVRRVHFVGIGGVGMCALAEILLDDGLVVSGCDSVDSDRTRRLVARGATVAIGHHHAHVEDCDAIIVSAAIAPDHPELEAARAHNIPVVRRATLVAEVIRGSQSVAIAGTHGKTTSTALLSHLLERAGTQPTAVVGGLVRGFDGYGKRGQSGIAVCEADEFDQAFLELYPLIAVVTNVEADHLDCYDSEETLHSAFAAFASRPPFHGSLLVCGDDPGAVAVSAVARAPVVTYGLNQGNDLRATDIQYNGSTSTFTVAKNGQVLGTVQLNLPGDHNVRNSLAALGAAMEFGLDFEVLSSACSDFLGVGRRFEHIGERHGVTVIDDYAHHPTEVTAVLSATREAFPKRRIVAVFQPHLFSRTLDFAEEFGRALANASLVIVLPIFPSREAPIAGVTHQLVLQSMSGLDTKALDGQGFEHIGNILDQELESGDVLVTMGAGDVDRVATLWMESANV